jgi:hypothetical protein
VRPVVTGCAEISEKCSEVSWQSEDRLVGATLSGTAVRPVQLLQVERAALRLVALEGGARS